MYLRPNSCFTVSYVTTERLEDGLTRRCRGPVVPTPEIDPVDDTGRGPPRTGDFTQDLRRPFRDEEYGLNCSEKNLLHKKRILQQGYVDRWRGQDSLPRSSYLTVDFSPRHLSYSPDLGSCGRVHQRGSLCGSSSRHHFFSSFSSSFSVDLSDFSLLLYLCRLLLLYKGQLYSSLLRYLDDLSSSIIDRSHLPDTVLVCQLTSSNKNT